MKLCTFEIRTDLGPATRLGVALPEGILDLNFASAAWFVSRGEPRPYVLAGAMAPVSMLEYLQGGDTCFTHATEVLAWYAENLPGRGPAGETLLYPRERVRLLAPLPNPASVRDFYAFEDHVKKGFEKRGESMPAEWYEMPVYYKSGHHHIIGTDEDALWPSFTSKFDYELELAAVAGRRGENVPASEAPVYIAGYTVMNDFSARDIQRKEMRVRLGPAKGKDWCTAIGPWLVTADEIGDPYNLRMAARVNGELWSEGNSGSIFWRFDQMIEFLTRDDFIVPGDVIGSGTVGSGCGLELDRWVQPGDVIELEIENIGVLRNRVVKRPAKEA
jgi:2-keto-4-pentenoate hydratase/2-oxohepta-3-ene-1,7-dioic acid hydratase in catechol pathway